MTLRNLRLGLSSVLFLLGASMYLPHSVSAQCVQADVSVQSTISGSRTPTNRENNTEFNSDPSCKGNSSVTVGEQTSVGGNNPTTQRRNVRHEQRGGSGNPSGVNGPTVQSDPSVGVDVYNPADN